MTVEGAAVRVIRFQKCDREAADRPSPPRSKSWGSCGRPGGARSHPGGVGSQNVGQRLRPLKRALEAELTQERA